MPNNRKMLTDLIVSVILTLILVYLSMGHSLLNLPFPEYLRNNQILLLVLRTVLSLSVIFINRRLFISGFSSLFRRSPNMDTLVCLGALAAFIYSVTVSVINLIYYSGAEEYIGDSELYFETCAMILTLVFAGKYIEELAKRKTGSAIDDLMDMSPKTALLMKNGQETEVAIDEVKVGDIFILKPGMCVPVDGIIETGTSAVNEASLTGESMPVDKEPGMPVSASTINMSGYLTCRATSVGGDTAFSRIVKMVRDTSSGSAHITKAADRISFFFIPAVIAAAIITFIIWMLSGIGIGFSLSRAISVLIVSCPCALALAAPVAIMAGSSVGAKHGILYKTAQAVESTGRTQIVVVDKTGTLTTGSPKVTDIISTVNDIEHRDLLLSIAYALESKSEHPLAKAICAFAEKRFVPVMETEDFEAIPGKGIRATLFVGGRRRTVYAGNEAFIGESLLGKTGDDAAEFDNDFSARIGKLVAEGKTPTLFASDSGMLGVIAAADEIKEGSREAIEALHNEEIHVCMVTGDRLATSEAVGALVGIEEDEVISEVMPEEKATIVEKLRETGRVAMIGDGVNDAPALSVADVGIAIGAGTDVAIDAADVVLVQNNLVTAVDAIRLSKETLRIIHQNLFWAFFYNVIGIPLAAGCYYKAFGWLLNPMFCAAAMSVSSFFVITNALRLFSFRTTEIIPESDESDDEEEDVL
ncbi:MAG: copper-translocating P-type ATPase [Lachnospiraceae bacterium]|nr:copper-translocating P-type ATPase [Lachnospiraceae bacterium]